MSRRPEPLRAPSASLRRYAGAYEKHAHDHAQVLLGLEGQLQLEVEGRPAFVDPSCALIVPAGMAHEYFTERRASVWVIDAPAGQGLERLRRVAVAPGLATAQGRGDPDALLAALAGARTLLPRRRLVLSALEQRIARGLHRRWTVAEMAALCSLSPQRFHARFVELTGLAPMAWLRRQRLACAQALLREGLTLDAAAARVGYASASALAYALRRDRGLGTRQIRAGC